jgi:hypothetical protein
MRTSRPTTAGRRSRGPAGSSRRTAARMPTTTPTSSPSTPG